MKQSQLTSPQDEQDAGFLPILVRLFWAVVGPGTLFFMAIFIAREGALSSFDAAYAALVAALVLARLFDIKRLGGLTTDNKPATMRHWARYSGLTLLLGAAGWGLAHTVLPGVLG